MDRFSFQADMFVWFVAVSICFWRTTLQSPSHSSTYWLLFPIRPGRFVATYSFALFCEISYLINGFYFPFFCDLRFLTKRNLYSLDFSSLNRNNRSISCNIMQNLGACCWLVHLFDACFQRFGINLTFLVGFSNFEYFRWKCCCAVRNWHVCLICGSVNLFLKNNPSMAIAQFDILAVVPGTFPHNSFTLFCEISDKTMFFFNQYQLITFHSAFFEIIW